MGWMWRCARLQPARVCWCRAAAVKVLGYRSFPYPRALREAVLRAMDAKAISTAELARLSVAAG